MPNYNSSAEVDTFMLLRLRTGPWDNATGADKNAALSMGTSIIDRLLFLGSKTVITQVNEFPRDPDTVIPQDIKDAHSLIILALLDGRDPEIEFENLSLTVHKYAQITSEYDRTQLPPHILAGVPSFEAWTILKPYLRDGSQISLQRVS